MKYILGNWKMHLSGAQGAMLAEKIAGGPIPINTQVVVFPPFTALSAVRESLSKKLPLGAQDVSPEKEGAFTGDVSAAQLKDAGCTYVIVGHSERRIIHKENDALVKQKAEAALAVGLIPVICVGESQQQRESGDYLEIITKQVRQSVPQTDKTFIIAYEPVWAIGSGKTPTLAEISQVHKTIESALSYATSGARAAIVYGGSVKAANAKDILSAEGVDGVLVGGASLNADEFIKIIEGAGN